MAYTDHCEVYGAIDEAAFNRLVVHLMHQRPSLFNYGTQMFSDSPELLCEPVLVHPEIVLRENPIISVEDPLPILGTDNLLGLNFCFQFVKLQVDFHPGKLIKLPPELNPPLKKQRMAIHAKICGAIVCPDDKMIDRYGEQMAAWFALDNEKAKAKYKNIPTQTIPGNRINCFCLDVYAVLHAKWTNMSGVRKLGFNLDGLEIVDILPQGLENSIECFVASALRLGILPRIRFAMDTFVLGLGEYATLLINPTPISADVPHNPSIEDDQLKTYIDVEVS